MLLSIVVCFGTREECDETTRLELDRDLRLAAHRGDDTEVERLLVAGADANSADENRWTPMHEAARSGSGTTLELLMRHGGVRDARTSSGDTPRWLATAAHGPENVAARFLAGECASIDECERTEASACRDHNANCHRWAYIGECKTNPDFLKATCPLSCRHCDAPWCADKADDCAARAANGGCYASPEMRSECAWTCIACEVQERADCVRPLDAEAALGSPGSLEALFASLRSREGVEVLSEAPWVLSFENFLSAAEAEAVLAAGSRSSYGGDWRRSIAGTEKGDDHPARPSSTIWCVGGCVEDAAVEAVEARVRRLTGVPEAHAEYMQLLRYEEGQFYRRHHDQNAPRSSPWGERVLTFFMRPPRRSNPSASRGRQHAPALVGTGLALCSCGGRYLSDDFDGGETHFPAINLTVTPRTGRAILWPSVLDADPHARDERADHEALPVRGGTKYAANYWLHMFPYRDAHHSGCMNRPYAANWR
jgi:hypothetical protein